MSAQERAVYRAVVNDFFRGHVVVVEDTTHAVRRVSDFSLSPYADTTLLRALEAAPGGRRLPPGRFGRRATVVPASRIAELYGDEPGMAVLREAYPGARYVVTLSAVGFSADRRQAVVQVSGTCGMVCGEGGLLHLVRDGDRWKVAALLALWNY
ncbi:MAG TPA: hypothetical protein VFQ39_09345 [Longimicrobium sp.]|nr:hypothetical protein [Longimicrobium sp.]